MKRKFAHGFGFPRTRTQRSGTQCNGTRTRWLFERVDGVTRELPAFVSWSSASFLVGQLRLSFGYWWSSWIFWLVRKTSFATFAFFLVALGTSFDGRLEPII